MLIGGVVAYESTQSMAETALIVFCGFPFYLFFAAIFMTLATTAFGSVWRWFQPDRGQFVMYRRELMDYQARFFRWLRLQEFWWQTLDGRRFEIELAIVFEGLGYDVRHTGRAGDGGIDLVISRDGPETIVQCKAHKRPIGPGPVRDLYGAMIAGKVQEAWLVTTNGFSRTARDFAKGKRIRLLKVREILKADRPFDCFERRPAANVRDYSSGEN